MKNSPKILSGLLIAAGVIVCVYFFWIKFMPAEPSFTLEPTQEIITTEDPLPIPDPATLEPKVEESALTPIPDVVGGLPVGKLMITGARKKYSDKDLTLRIPAINVDRPIYNGTDAATLSKGVCLYEQAQLPGQGNRNVSLAGHRNGRTNGIVTDRAPFYYVDLLKEGDYLYLYDSEYIYRYIWEYCEIVEPSNWDPIRTTGYSCITITSCHPIGISDHRIVVRGLLDDIIPYDKNYGFPASAEDLSQ